MEPPSSFELHPRVLSHISKESEVLAQILKESMSSLAIELSIAQNIPEPINNELAIAILTEINHLHREVLRIDQAASQLSSSSSQTSSLPPNSSSSSSASKRSKHHVGHHPPSSSSAS